MDFAETAESRVVHKTKKNYINNLIKIKHRLHSGSQKPSLLGQGSAGWQGNTKGNRQDGGCPIVPPLPAGVSPPISAERQGDMKGQPASKMAATP